MSSTLSVWIQITGVSTYFLKWKCWPTKQTHTTHNVHHADSLPIFSSILGDWSIKATIRLIKRHSSSLKHTENTAQALNCFRTIRWPSLLLFLLYFNLFTVTTLIGNRFMNKITFLIFSIKSPIININKCHNEWREKKESLMKASWKRSMLSTRVERKFIREMRVHECPRP